jgi:hypothetical protein
VEGAGGPERGAGSEQLSPAEFAPRSPYGRAPDIEGRA